MITAYFFGSSIRIPPIFTNSASTPSTFIELTFSTKAGGNVFSIPNKIPIFLVLTKTLLWRRCFERLFSPPARKTQQGTSVRNLCPKNTSPPSAATAASHASSYPRKCRASAESSCHLKSPKTSHSDPDKYPNPPIPAQFSSAGNGSKTSRHACWANSPEDY